MQARYFNFDSFCQQACNLGRLAQSMDVVARPWVGERNQRVIFIMIVVVEPHNAEKHAYLLEQMFRMRARIFRDHLGWDVVVKDGKERDKYDEQSPVYIIYTDEGGHKVKGSLRLLPTTGPTLVADFFSDTASGCGEPHGADDLGMHALLPRRRRLAKEQGRDSFRFDRTARRFG